jgi:hypothetical protein
VYDRFVRWRRDGTWDRLPAEAQTKSDAVGEVTWEVSVDSTSVRASSPSASRAARWQAASMISRSSSSFAAAQFLRRDRLGGRSQLDQHAPRAPRPALPVCDQHGSLLSPLPGPTPPGTRVAAGQHAA